MKNFIYGFLRSDFENKAYNLAFFFYRIALAVEMIVVHGMKKVAHAGHVAEIVPNPFGLPDGLNQASAFTCTLILPFFVIAGLATRAAAFFTAIIPLTGYFIIHWNGSLAEKDVPFMYFLSFFLVAVFGGGKYSIDNYFAETIK